MHEKTRILKASTNETLSTLNPLNEKMYDCDYQIPENGTIDGYPSLKNVTCSYCSLVC